MARDPAHPSSPYDDGSGSGSGSGGPSGSGSAPPAAARAARAPTAARPPAAAQTAAAPFAVTPLLEFASPAVEAAWLRYANRAVYPRLDLAVGALNFATNFAVAWRLMFGLGAPAAAGASCARGFRLLGADALLLAAHAAVVARRRDVYARHRVLLVLTMRVARCARLFCCSEGGRGPGRGTDNRNMCTCSQAIAATLT